MVSKRSSSTNGKRQGDNTLLETGSTCGLPACQQVVLSGLECSMCAQWFHPLCAKVTQSDFRKHQENSNLPWFCEGCGSNPAVRAVMCMINWLEQRSDTNTIRLESLLKEQTVLMIDLQNQLTALQRPVTSIANMTNSSPPPRPKKRIRTANRTPDPCITRNMEVSPIKLNEVHQPNTVLVSVNQKKRGTKEQANPTAGMTSVTSCDLDWSIPKTRKVSSQKPCPERDDLSLICTNVTEIESLSLRSRHESDLKQWQEINVKLGVQILPSTLTRLSRHPTSPHSGEPRLLRVTLRSSEDMEAVLLSTYKLRGSSAVRIFPDVPWSERRKRTLDSSSTKAIQYRKTVLVHGVPTPPDDDAVQAQHHDLNEWQFIRELLNLQEITTTGLSRIPFSPNYKGSGPQILKVSVLTESMVTSILEAWYARRRQAPPELRLRAAHDTPLGSRRSQTNATNSLSSPNTTACSTLTDPSADLPVTVTVPKNVPLPTQVGSATE